MLIGTHFVFINCKGCQIVLHLPHIFISMKKKYCSVLFALFLFVFPNMGYAQLDEDYEGMLDMKKNMSQVVYDNEVPNHFVKENTFIKKQPNTSKPPTYNEAKKFLPKPYWKNNQGAIDTYWRAWEIAFANLSPVVPNTGFVSPYLNPGFSDCIFMWDTNFMMMFGKYGERAFHFQGSMDNFYAKQEKDGYICREINGNTGWPKFERYNISSTGPNIMPWSEWEYYLTFKDKKRLNEVFPALLAYYQWTYKYRTWQDGTYYSSGWGCGMDNQPRMKPEFNERWDHGFMSWLDATLQAVMTGKILLKMANELGRENDVKSVKYEVDELTETVNKVMWDDKTAFYYDKFKDGSLNYVMSIGAYWALLADVVPTTRIEPFIAHLENKNEFDRPHRIPTLAASHPLYKKDGGYWKGGVWAPTNYMVLRGLTNYKQDSLAHEIAKNHNDEVVKVFQKTNTLYENYAPEMNQGNGRSDFVGWTGLAAINMLIEYRMGIRPNVPANTLVIDVRELDEYGILDYPFGMVGTLNIQVSKRKKLTDIPKINIKSNVDLTIDLRWENGKKLIPIKKNI